MNLSQFGKLLHILGIVSAVFLGCHNAFSIEEGRYQNSGGQLDLKSPSGLGKNLFTGDMGFSVPIELSPTRGGFTVPLELSYSSSAANGHCGVGWRLDLGSIERDTTKGVPVKWTSGVAGTEYDDSKGFILNLLGRSHKLIRIGDITNGIGEYRCETEGQFLKILYKENSWEVYDENGTKMTFGTTASTRLFNSKSGWSQTASSGTFAWALDKLRDVTGNTITATYLKTNTSTNILYVTQISLNGNENGSTIAANQQVGFEWEDRPDKIISYGKGFRSEMTKRLKTISVTTASSLVRKYSLAYSVSPSTGKSLIADITLIGSDNTSSRKIFQFDYSKLDFGFSDIVEMGGVYTAGHTDKDWNSVVSGTINGGGVGYIGRSTLVDLDGDGLPDRLKINTNSPYNVFRAQRNVRNGVFPASWYPATNDFLLGPVSSVGQTAQDWNSFEAADTYSRFVTLMDINNDGYPDRVMQCYTNLNNFSVQLGSGRIGATNYFGPEIPWGPLLSDYATADYRSPYSNTASAAPRCYVALMDINGDGMLDRVVMNDGSPNYMFLVQLNTGTGFESAFKKWDGVSGMAGDVGWNSIDWYSYVQQYWWSTETETYANVAMIDVNGDGLVDRVMQGYNSPFDKLVVQLNNGFGFEAKENWGPLDSQGITSVGWNSPDFAQHTVWSSYYRQETVSDKESVLIDMNGDGLPDRLMRKVDAPYDKFVLQMNTGFGFATNLVNITNVQGNFNDLSPTIQGRTPYTLQYNCVQVTMIDINGDGLPDRVMRNTNANYDKWLVQINKGGKPDLISAIKNETGGATYVKYRPSTQFDNTDLRNAGEPWNAKTKSLLPYAKYVVVQMETADGLGNTNTTTYSYEGGMYDFKRNEFCGFSIVEVLDPIGKTTRLWFHQGGGRDETASGEYNDTATNSFVKRGMIFRMEEFGADGKIYKLTLNKVEARQVAPGVHFPFIEKTVDFIFADGTNYRSSAVSYGYDTNTGNLLASTNHGEVRISGIANYGWSQIESNLTDISSDEVYTFISWYGVGGTSALSNAEIRNKPASNIVTSDSLGTQILRETLYTYNGTNGLLTMQRDRICASTYATNRYSYDPYGNLRFKTNPVGVVSETTYESTYQTSPLQDIHGTFISSRIQDPRSGIATNEVAISGLVKQFICDAFFRITESRISSASNGIPNIWKEKYAYSSAGITNGNSFNYVHLTKNNDVSGDSGHETITYFDGLGRQIQVRVESEAQAGYTAPFRVTGTAYNGIGNVQYQFHHKFAEGGSFVKPDGTVPTIYNNFDSFGRIVRCYPYAEVTFSGGLPSGVPTVSLGETDSPLGVIFTSYSDGTNAWVRVRQDEEGKITKYYLDAFGSTNRIAESTSDGEYTTIYEYDKLNRLAKITDHKGNTTEWAYDDIGDMIAQSEPNLGLLILKRDYAGRIRMQTDGNGNTIRYYYTVSGQQDPLGRLMRKEIYSPDGLLLESTTNRYDSSDSGTNYTVYPGQLAAIYDRQGWQKFSYDVSGRVLKDSRFLNINTNTYTTQFTYDDADRIKTTTYPSGTPIVQNIYDTGARLYSVQKIDTGGSPYVYYVAKSRNALGQSSGAIFGNGVETTVEYFGVTKRLSRLKTVKGATELQNLTYKYTTNDNIKSIIDNVASHTNGASGTITVATYDDLNRLKTIARPIVGTVNYSYDAIGNLKINGEDGESNYYYGTARPHAVKRVNGKVYTYDLAGNMVWRNGQKLSYDGQNRLISIATNQTNIATFGYDYDGKRLWKQTAGGTDISINSLYETRNGEARFHIFTDSKRICTVEPGTGNTYYIHDDQLSSASILTDASGGQVRHWEYTPFGRENYPKTVQSFTIANRFTGQIFDDETGLYYYGARYYDCELGRFTQPDLIVPDIFSPQSLNRYSYARNNPLRYLDPSGHWEIPSILYDWMPDSMMRALNSGGSAPRKSDPDTVKFGFASQRAELMGAWDDTQQKQFTGLAKATIAVTPVGVVNTAYTGVTGNNAISPDQKVSNGERIQSISETAAILLPAAKIALEAKTVELGAFASYSANSASQVFSPKVVMTGDTIVFHEFALGVENVMLGGKSKGAAELVGPLKEMIKFSQQHGAKKITLLGKYATEEGAKLGGGKVGDTFSFTFEASKEGFKTFLKSLRQ